MDILSYTLGKKAGGVQPTGEIDITQNGITNVSGYATANVQVPEKQLEEKSVTISSNTTTLIEPSSGKDGMSSVSVTTNIPQPTGTISITQNGTGIDVSSYASADVNVPAGADLSEYFNSTPSSNNGKSCIKKFPPITLPGNTMSSMFSGFYSLIEIPTITNISDITNFNNTFEYCRALENADFSNSTFSNSAQSFGSMFFGCNNLENVNLSTLVSNTYNVAVQSMFANCTNLKKVDLSNFAPKSFNGTSSMFSGCTSLEELDISSMTMPNNWFSGMFDNIPTNCLILVKDQTQKDWFTTNFSSLTNVQIKSQYIANQGA